MQSHAHRHVEGSLAPANIQHEVARFTTSSVREAAILKNWVIVPTTYSATAGSVKHT
jgi:hypothetical protein